MSRSNDEDKRKEDEWVPSSYRMTDKDRAWIVRELQKLLPLTKEHRRHAIELGLYLRRTEGPSEACSPGERTTASEGNPPG